MNARRAAREDDVRAAAQEILDAAGNLDLALMDEYGGEEVVKMFMRGGVPERVAKLLARQLDVGGMVVWSIVLENTDNEVC